MRGSLVRLVKRSRWAVIAKHVLFSRAALRGQIGEHAQSAGTTSAEAVDYIEGVFEALMRHAGIEPSDLEGTQVLELGPGDNLGLALRLIAAGAERVVTLDRFAVPRDPDHERRIYAELLARLPERERARGEAALAEGRIDEMSGIAIEDASETLAPGSFDLIVSIAVLEHVHDLEASFDAMNTLLAPEGLMLHQVDLSDHGMFSGGGQHPLTFLTISPRLWRAMTTRWGGPNRRLIDVYRRQVERLGYGAELIVNEVLCSNEDAQRRLIDRIRSRLQPQFRLSDEDLAASGILLVARKRRDRVQARAQ